MRPSRDHGARKEAGAAERLPRTTRFDVGKDASPPSGTLLALPKRLSTTTRKQLPAPASKIAASAVPYIIEDYVRAKRDESAAKSTADALRDGLLPVVRQAYAKRWCDDGARPKRPVCVTGGEARIAYVVTEPSTNMLSDDVAMAIADAGFRHVVRQTERSVYDPQMLHSAAVVQQIRRLVAAGDLPCGLLKSEPTAAYTTTAEAALNSVAAQGPDALQRFLHVAAASVRQHFTV